MEITERVQSLEKIVSLNTYKIDELIKISNNLEQVVQKLSDISQNTTTMLQLQEQKFDFIEESIASTLELQKKEFEASIESMSTKIKQEESTNKKDFYTEYRKYIFGIILLLGWIIGRVAPLDFISHIIKAFL